MAKDTTIAVDLAKSVSEVAVFDRPGRVAERQRLSRGALLRFFAQRAPATVLLEACGSAHFWARDLERRIGEAEDRLEALGRGMPLVARLRSVPGIGLLTATALAGFVGDLTRFPSGRHFASYLGLTPRERSTGGVRRLGAITKRGDVYLRMLLIHGARAVLAAAGRQREPDAVRRWALAASARLGHNKATVALANKLARYAWAVATRERSFDVEKQAA